MSIEQLPSKLSLTANNYTLQNATWQRFHLPAMFAFRHRSLLRNDGMFWNLVAVKYEKYKLHHALLFSVLLIYSVLGAIIFCAIESPAEDARNTNYVTESVRKSVLAKRKLVEQIQRLYFSGSNNTDFQETRLRIALDHYDIAMETKPSLQVEKKWDMWGGLYYSGTIYTTIGYGDFTTMTVWGKIFTMVYAIIGIPVVITILTDWGTLMFQLVNRGWQSYGNQALKRVTQWIKKLHQKEEPIEDLEKLCAEQNESYPGETEEEQPIPLILVAIVLVFWFVLCSAIFALFEGWSFFDSLYFFFISLTTIGFGDLTPSPRVAVANFLLILIGLSVVSMSINVVQMQLEIMFARIIKMIDSDFKANLSISAEENKKIATTGDTGLAETEDSTVGPKGNGDVVEKYGENMGGTDKLLMRFMSHHQRKMLNEKFEERSKMRNKWTQTMTQIKVVSVQTAGKYDDLLAIPDEEEEEPKVKSRINAKRLYIYNTGE